MERLASLINSLKTGFEEGRSVTALLSLVDELRNELTKSQPAPEPAKSPVAVWLPAGYQPPPQIIKEPVMEAKMAEPVIQPDTDEPFIANIIRDSIQIHPVQAVADPIDPLYNQPAGAQVPNGVPRPPRVAFLEETENEPEERETVTDKTASFSAADDFLLPGNYHVQPSGIFRETMQGPVRPAAQEHDADLPIVVELELPEETEKQEMDDLHNHSMTITENFLKSPGNTATAARPLELHEILANRVVAQPANTETAKQPKVLADTLSGGKITDLRKAIAINDRFRFIKSLFRGDDNLFERSVKTINNFNILQEAQYWMQRELVIKLGWNEEDELVQMFYQLVSRRFL